MSYRDDGRTEFCTVCQVSIIKGTRIQHEAQNPRAHPKTTKNR